jgi:hypothetical protein
MTAKVFEFKKPDGESPHHRPDDHALRSEIVYARSVTKLRTNQEIFQDVIEDVLGDWQRFAVKNRLNEFIAGKLPSHVKGRLDDDYCNDLNILSKVEVKLGMKVAVFYPGCTINNTYGWLVAFHRGTEIFTTPADMASEANARALNIVLYLAFEHTMKTLGRA